MAPDPTAHDKAAGSEWIAILQRVTLEEFAEAFTPNVTLEASVLAAALREPRQVRAFFEATKKMYDRVAFVSEAASGRNVYLEWEGQFQNELVAGITVLEKAETGHICHIRLHHRPLNLVIAFAADLQHRLHA